MSQPSEPGEVQTEVSGALPRPAPPLDGPGARSVDGSGARSAHLPPDGPKDIEEARGSSLQSAMSVLTILGPPVTIATALMIYFGWARTQQQARFMGLDGSLFGYTAQDYVLRSINTLYIPLLVLAVLVLGWLAVHNRITGWLRRPALRPMLRTAGRGTLYIGLATAAGSVLTVTVDRPRAPLAVPLALAGGIAVAAYGQWLLSAASPRRNARHGTAPWQRALKTLVVGGIIALALFWELSEYAGVVGRGSALQIARSVDSLPRATAFSTAPLGIEAPGVREERVDGGSAATGVTARYRTTGLRLLVRSGGRIFLLHDGWTPQQGTVIVLPDSDEVSWQFSR